MSEKRTIGVVGDGFSYTSAYLLRLAAARAAETCTVEEKAENEKRKQFNTEQRIKAAKIRKNICPDCDGKLVRGKKDKKNDYKREWCCASCHSQFYM